MFLSVFLGSLAGYICGALIVVGYSALRSKIANRRVDKHVKELVAAMREDTRDAAIIRVPLTGKGPGEN